jgi:hypothetical protein
MNQEDKQVVTALHEITVELKAFRRAVLSGFAIFSAIGAAVFVYGSSDLPGYLFLAATGCFFSALFYSRLAKLVIEIVEEARKTRTQERPTGAIPPPDDTRTA